jgi:hypothetical protein
MGVDYRAKEGKRCVSGTSSLYRGGSSGEGDSLKNEKINGG